MQLHLVQHHRTLLLGVWIVFANTPGLTYTSNDVAAVVVGDEIWTGIL